MTAHRAGSAAAAAIGQAAIGLGLPNPMTTADDLMAVDVDALHEWFGIAGRIMVLLWQGAERISDALPLLSAGWSRTEPRVAIARHREAGLTARDTVSRQFDAADNAVATLRQSRVLADAEVSGAESAALALGWSPGEDLVGWAIENQALAAVASIVGVLHRRVTDLRARNDDALHVLATTLRADPGESIEPLLGAARAPSSLPIQWSSASGSQRADPTHAGAPTVSPSAENGLDSDNLARLAADLRSTDISTLAMAMGVNAALDAARQDGSVGQLLVYESASSTSQGRAAISVGDVSTADNVAIFAPGVSSAPVTMTQGIGSAAAIRNESQRQSPGDRTAVVSWYGYDIPLSALGGVPVTTRTAADNLTAALDDEAALNGGSMLVQDISQFRLWAPDTARFIGMGFSMGSTTVSAAAAKGADFDDLILLGSPGASSAVETADDYPEMTAEHVHVLSYDNDPITRPTTDVLASLAGSVPRFSVTEEPFGPDPAAEDFGAQVIDATSNNPDVSVTIETGMVGGLLTDPMVNAATNELADLINHHQEGNYLSGSSLASVAAVVTGRYSQVPVKTGR